MVVSFVLFMMAPVIRVMMIMLIIIMFIMPSAAVAGMKIKDRMRPKSVIMAPLIGLIDIPDSFRKAVINNRNRGR
jgi:hypothetical protein